MRDLIVAKLTAAQKLGIIPIVLSEEENADKEGTRKKFEFDLFALDAETFGKLEKYVRACSKTNEEALAAGQTLEDIAAPTEENAQVIRNAQA